jgi:hypothetical protein
MPQSDYRAVFECGKEVVICQSEDEGISWKWIANGVQWIFILGKGTNYFGPQKKKGFSYLSLEEDLEFAVGYSLAWGRTDWKGQDVFADGPNSPSDN